MKPLHREISGGGKRKIKGTRKGEMLQVRLGVRRRVISEAEKKSC